MDWVLNDKKQKWGAKANFGGIMSYNCAKLKKR